MAPENDPAPEEKEPAPAPTEGNTSEKAAAADGDKSAATAGDDKSAAADPGDKLAASADDDKAAVADPGGLFAPAPPGPGGCGKGGGKGAMGKGMRPPHIGMRPPPGMFHPGMGMHHGMGHMPGGYPGMHGMPPGMPPGMHGWPGMPTWHGYPPGMHAKAKKDKKEGKDKKEKEKADKKRKKKCSASSAASSEAPASSSSAGKKKKKKKGKGKDKGKDKKKDKKKGRKRSPSPEQEEGVEGELGDDLRAAAARAAVAGALAVVAERSGKASAKERRIAAGRSQSQDSASANKSRSVSRPKKRKSRFDDLDDLDVSTFNGELFARAAAAAQAAADAVANRPGDLRRLAPASAVAPSVSLAASPAAALVAARAPDTRSGWDAAGVSAMDIKQPECLEVLPLPRDIIGRIIGKGGATIKEIRERSGARVDARDQTEDPVQVLISGTRDAVEAAKAMLHEAADMARAAFGTPMRSAFVDDAVARARAQAETAAAAVSAAAAGAGTSVASSAASSPGAGPSVEGVVDLPKHATGKIIGTKGSQIAEIRSRSGAQVDVDKSTSSCRVRLVGTQQQVDNARAIIAQLMLPVAGGGQEGTSGEYLEIPKGSVGRVIGAGGARIQELQERSGAKIDIDRTQPDRILVRFAGFPENVAAAKTMVAEVLEGKDRSVQGDAQTTLEVPSSCTGRLIGPGGKQINDIQERSGAKVDVDKSREPCIVRIVGTTESVTAAEAMVREVISAMPPSQLYGRPSPRRPPLPQGAVGAAGADEETIRFDCQLSVLEKLLSCEGGNWSHGVTAKTGARIQVKRDASGTCFLELIGQPEQVVEAESLCDDAVRVLSITVMSEAAEALASGSGPSAFQPGNAPGAVRLQRPRGPPPGATTLPQRPPPPPPQPQFQPHLQPTMSIFSPPPAAIASALVQPAVEASSDALVPIATQPAVAPMTAPAPMAPMAPMVPMSPMAFAQPPPMAMTAPHGNVVWMAAPAMQYMGQPAPMMHMPWGMHMQPMMQPMMQHMGMHMQPPPPTAPPPP